MKFFIVLSAIVLAAYAAEHQILRNEQDIHPDGHYTYNYETSNGISAQESGSLKNPETLVAQGHYAFKTPEGEVVEVNYVADENGFQPSGAVLPVAPPLPPYIQRALEYIAAHPYVEKKH